MAKTPEEKYTDPELRERLKQEILASDRGGQPGQWSARKSQLLVREYEAHGGGYLGEKDEAARSLEHWTEQDWQTLDGGERARHGGSVSRYLPKAVWEALSPVERREAEGSKVRGSREGEQHVDWPPAVRRALERLEREQDGK